GPPAPAREFLQAGAEVYWPGYASQQKLFHTDPAKPYPGIQQSGNHHRPITAVFWSLHRAWLHCWFYQTNWQPRQKSVCIGPTTERAEFSYVNPGLMLSFQATQKVLSTSMQSSVVSL